MGTAKEVRMLTNLFEGTQQGVSFSNLCQQLGIWDETTKWLSTCT